MFETSHTYTLFYFVNDKMKGKEALFMASKASFDYTLYFSWEKLISKYDGYFLCKMKRSRNKPVYKKDESKTN